MPTLRKAMSQAARKFWLKSAASLVRHASWRESCAFPGNQNSEGECRNRSLGLALEDGRPGSLVSEHSAESSQLKPIPEFEKWAQGVVPKGLKSGAKIWLASGVLKVAIPAFFPEARTPFPEKQGAKFRKRDAYSAGSERRGPRSLRERPAVRGPP